MSEASANAADTAEAPVSGSKKKLILIIVTLLVLLAGGGGAAYYFMVGAHSDEQQTAEAETDDADDGKPAKKGKNGAVEKKHKKPSAPAVYYKVDPALVVNFQANGVTRFLQVAIEIATRDPLLVEELKLHDPVIRNDLLMLLGSQDETTVSTREGKDKLRAQALDVVRNVITREGGAGDKIENVYFTSFVMQ